MTDEPKKKKGWNKGNTLHGMSQSATYQTWRRLKLSCGPTAKRPCKKWPRTMDGRWMADFILFLQDMGEQPDGTVLRIRKGSPNGRMHYGPAECEWRPKDEPHYKRVMFDPAAIAHAATIRRSKALAAELSEPAAAEQQAQRATREPIDTGDLICIKNTFNPDQRRFFKQPIDASALDIFNSWFDDDDDDE